MARPCAPRFPSRLSLHCAPPPQADPVSGEVEGVFITHQLSSDDMGAKDPSDVEVQGMWYAQLSS